MRSKMSISGIVFLAAFALCLGPATALETPKDARLYPQGRTMLFSLYSVTQPELSRVKADGFTAVGPYYGNREQASEFASIADLPYLHLVGPRIDFNEGVTASAQDEALETLIDDVSTARNDPALAAWYLGTEELRFWKSDEMRWLDEATNAIRIHDPGERPILMYEPGHRSAADLGHTTPYLDAVTKGAYANLVGMKDSRTWMRWNVEQTVAAAVADDKVPIAVLLMYRDQDEADVPLIRRWTRHDVYLSLMTGAKGILIYSGDNRRPGFQRDFGEFYEGYASAARELNGELNLSQVFLFGTPLAAPTIETVSGPAVESFEYLGQSHQYPTVSSLSLSTPGQAWWFLLNSAAAPVQITSDALSAGWSDVLADGSAVDAESLTLGAYELRALVRALP